ncbi:NAD(P)H-hydrate dehydratase [Noviherbaspirillum cavernae]|uniref:Bifunctional NAD(P)H-hydrate repair enzyme n=1 Tax=Noviherbaspirillum cavernae TaxID=2320862 RepID=A0A418X114_9BURK|nr:NAD(P)H-hydrate dehydratase [Noviherbaspirillum cavernae]RJG06035.1 NAD(P)H-hydrate dehydratase [Noviherbaspirillum cavernae]
MPSPTALFSASEIRDIERAAQTTLPAGTLMQRAGEAAAELALELIQSAGDTANVLILAGPGNNGGDALEAAYRLAQGSLEVTIVLCADPARQPLNARQALLRAQSSAACFVDTDLRDDLFAEKWDLVIDGLFGIGLTRAIDSTVRPLVQAVNVLACPVLSLDVPSGLDADTGNIVGENGIAIRASHTITFIGNKPGLHTAHGKDYAGAVRVASLDIDEACFIPFHAELNDVRLFSSHLRLRMHNSHKGSYGDVTVIGGARGMGGAAILAARAAAKSGAGRVYAAFIDDAPTHDSLQPELMCRNAVDHDFASGTFVAGPGLGISSTARNILERALNAQVPLVLDADALNLIAADTKLQTLAARHASPLILTPHPLEAARLLGVSSATIQDDRLAAARQLARLFNATIVLKGSGTVIATPGDNAVINTTGNPALATAGTGDVLAGMCGALLAQGWPEREAAVGAAWLHGHAADVLVEQGIGPTGLTASELIPAIRASLNQLINKNAQHGRTL